ncbi:MAG: DUF5359 family protein [Firmicutes bacterium]|jgi:hypothetical protein|nr:DUF5359 family protein [Bacillota bacterium]
MDFDKWLQRFVTKVEKIIFRLALGLVVLLFLIQTLLMEDDARLFLSKTHQFEGIPVMENIQDVIGKKIVEEETSPVTAEEKAEEKALVLRLLPPEGVSIELFLLINNKIYAQFGEADIYVTVEPGDILELVGEVPGNTPATVKIVKVYGELRAPKEGLEVNSFGEKELLAWIIP